MFNEIYIYIYIYVRMFSERSDTKSNVKLAGYRSQLQASYISSHTDE